MSDEKEIKSLLKAIFKQQKFGVLSTHDKGQPYATLVAFIANDKYDLIFSTSRSTRKYQHISADPRAAMLIDSRTNTMEDIANAVAITASGKVIELNADEKTPIYDSFLQKHQGLNEFIKAPSTAMLKLQVKKFTVVRQFQFVTEWFKK